MTELLSLRPAHSSEAQNCNKKNKAEKAVQEQLIKKLSFLSIFQVL
jgi:hypothetical protein